MAICEAVSGRGGGHLWEHPADPGCPPYASVYVTDEMLGMEARTNAKRVRVHQCCAGAPVQKATDLSSTCVAISDLEVLRCPGVSKDHLHPGKSEGLNEKGEFHTRRLQTYPPEFCRLIAWHAYLTLQVMKEQGAGPTGFLHPSKAMPTTTAWSTLPSAVCNFGVRVLNEEVSNGRRVLLHARLGAVYLHVDDVVALCEHNAIMSANQVMHAIADGMEALGFDVSDRTESDKLVKVIGFKVDQQQSRFSLPSEKLFLLHACLLELASARFIDVELLRCVVGVWCHGVQLRRDLLSIPFAVYRFLEVCEGLIVKPWRTVATELSLMAHTLALMFYDASLPISKVLMASDAMGAGSSDKGGYGIVATHISNSERSALLANSEHFGRTITHLGGSTHGLKNPHREIKPNIPFSLLPSSITNINRWQCVGAGRWHWADHITLGEARAVRKTLEATSLIQELHSCVQFSLQDNQPCAGAMHKGRSPAYTLNTIIRRKSALCLATFVRLVLPWIESSRMPADSLSRLI